MANPFSNPAIYIDGSGDKSSSVYADYTPSSDRYTKEDVDRMNEQRKVYQEQTTKNIEAKKEEAKQKESTTNAQQKKPDDGSQWVTKLDKTKDTLISSAGVDVEKYRKALDEAIKHSKEGMNVLLSPACASFDEYKNYEERRKSF